MWRGGSSPSANGFEAVADDIGGVGSVAVEQIVVC